MIDIEKKIKEIEEELSLSESEFEKKLTDKLREEIKINKAKLEEDIKKEL